ncbi:MAG: DNA repair protein RecN [Coriobacteriia bacterium]|nr:DNA repair protein RecN [Coriobacteriia bacterium]MCL2536837.1 DNA repair protein RecN [Coriobacteriia bacterium]
MTLLRDLHIKDFALIDDVWLEFGPGLTVLTGETGAGKTVLLSALELVMGGRGDSGQIAAGADKALVEACFDTPAELTVSRSMTSSGRTRVLLDGELSSVSALQKQICSLIDLHGQHDHQALLSPARHVEYLDRWAGADIEPLFEAYTTAREQWQQAAADLGEVEELLARSLEESAAGKVALADIEAIDPQPGEDDELRARIPALQNASTIAELAASAQASLRGEGATLESLYRLGDVLEEITGFDKTLDELNAELARARSLIEGIADVVDSYASGIEHDPRIIEESFERLATLESLSKRYGPTLDAVLARKERLLTLIDVSENSDERLFDARDREAATRRALEDAAASLHGARATAATDFIKQLSAAAEDLELGKVRFDIEQRQLPFDQWTATGSDQIEILYAPAPAVPVRPLAKIASGGEVSRVMLALKSVLGDADKTGILIFDEVDAGIGGATGLAIGAKLKKLAASHQVIVVTHLAQVAAFADAHFLVSKVAEGGLDHSAASVQTTVALLDDQERISEIARMLSGSSSETALTHARELIELATGV